MIAQPEISFSASGHFQVKSVSAYAESFVEITQQRRIPGFAEEGDVGGREREVEGIKVYVAVHNSASPDPNGVLKDVFMFPNPNRYLLPATRSENRLHSSQMIDPLSHRLSTTSSRLWSDAIYTETKFDAIALIRSFDPDIEDIDLVLGQADRPVVSVKHKKLKRAPLSTFGDGLRRIFTFAVAIPGAREGLLLVDELELAIHTGAIEKTFSWLIKACIQNEVQLFATTHSLETVDVVLNAIGEDIDLVTYRLRKNEDDVTVTRFDKQLLSQLRNELGLEVR